MPAFRVTWDGGITFHYLDYPLTDDIIRQLQRSGAVVHEFTLARQGYQAGSQGQVQGQVQGLGYGQILGQVQGQVDPVFGQVPSPMIALRAVLSVPQIVTTIDLNFVQRAQFSQAPINLQLFSGIQIPNSSVILLAPPAPPPPAPPAPVRCQCGFSIKSKKSSCQFKRRVFNCFQTAILNLPSLLRLCPITNQRPRMSAARRRRGHQAQEAVAVAEQNAGAPAVAAQVEQVDAALIEQVAPIAVEPQHEVPAVNGGEAEAPQAHAPIVAEEANAVVVEPIVAAAPGLAPPVPMEPMEPVAPIPGLNLLGLFNLLQPQGLYNPGQLNNPNGNPPFQALPLPPINAQPSGGRGARFRHCKRLIKESLDRREALGSAILQNARAKEEELVAVGLDVFDDCQDVVQLVQISRAALDVAQDVEGDGAQQSQQENNGGNN